MSRSNDIDPKRVTAAGSGVDQTVTGEECRFQIHNLKGKVQLLSMSIDGPSSPTILPLADDDGVINCTYTPTLPGDYQVTIKVMEKHIKGSPYKVQVLGDSDPKLERIKKIEVAGKGIAVAKAFQQNEFWIDGRAANINAGITINIKNPERASAQVKISDMGDGTLKVMYKPTAAGWYVIYVKAENINVPNSPFYVRAT